ncbi:hypothetical protein LQW54_005124 [Pestalotiopsis sp. IQ-011]
MDLLDLPPELLSRIIEITAWVTPRGYENLMLTCKTVHAHGARTLASHNANKGVWKKISFTDPDPWKSIGASLQYAEEPAFAEYTEVADFRIIGSWGVEQEDYEPYEMADPILPHELKSLEDLMLHSPVLPDHIRSPTFWGEFRRLFIGAAGDRTEGLDRLWDWSLILLISQLKYITELTLPLSWPSKHHAQDVEPDPNIKHDKICFGAAECLMRNTHLSEPDEPLKHCKILRFLGPVHHRVRLSTVSPFLALKNVEELYAIGFTAEDLDDFPSLLYQWPYPELVSPLQRLELLGCNIDARSMANLLAHTPLLIVLRYSHVAHTMSFYNRQQDYQSIELTRHRGRGASWNAAAFVASIAKHCGHQLIELAITLAEVRMPTETIRISNPISTMKEFACLEHAELEVAIFEDHSFEIEPTKVKWHSVNVPKLVEILPPSLKTLKLFDGYSRGAEVAEALMKDFAAGRTWLLSDLEDVSYRHRTYRLDGYPTANFSKVEGRAGLEGIPWSSGHGLNSAWEREFGKTHGAYQPL